MIGNSDSSHFAIEPEFFDRADDLRAEFEARVASDRLFTTKRLVWDYWYVEGQFVYFRSPARLFFSPSLYKAFLASLCDWGKRRLGCGKCSDLWISFYIDGCRQELHTDPGNGAWGIIFSLTDWKGRNFSGGETVILRPEILDYWRHYESGNPLKRNDIFHLVPPEYNQLLVFDARIPHGVNTVEGSRDPLTSRAVIHGWFSHPDVTIEGTLAWEDVNPIVARIRADWRGRCACLGPLLGTLTLRLTVDAQGRVADPRKLSSTLISSEARHDDVRRAESLACEAVENAVFVESNGQSVLTVPFDMES